MNNKNKYENYNEGYLEIILGSMFSGKTSRLLDIYKQYQFCNIKILVLNYLEDKRYSNDDDKLYTHDKTSIPCKSVEFLSIIDDKWLSDYKVILINEGQFFPDLYDFVNLMVTKYKKRVYVCGLDGDFERKKFGTILDLIPLADEVVKMKSLCSICKNGKKGIFTHRISEEKKQKIIGSDSYIPLCRSCYEKNNKIR